MKIKQILEKLEIRNLDEASPEDRKSNSFVFRGLPNELALTIGNYLRRILLSYIDGVAITGVRISNGKETLKSEFVPLEGVLETPPYIILNLKNLVLKARNESPGNVGEYTLNADIENSSDKEYTVTGNDIKSKNSELEVLNGDVYIATMSPYSALHLEIRCRKFWGFSKEGEKKLLIEEGLIAMDSNYNPVKNVSFRVDMVVVDLSNQEEQLTVNIKTNGSITPREALSSALDISNSINHVLLDRLGSLTSIPN